MRVLLDECVPRPLRAELSDHVTIMRARLVKIGNSRGIRLPKPLIEQTRLPDEVEVEVRDGALIITAPHRVRSGWAEAARELRERDVDRLLDDPVATRFEDKDWKWR